MNTVYKYPIQRGDSQWVAMPHGAKPLHVGLDPNGILCLWALVEESKPMQDRRVYVVGTGHPINFNAHYVGSVNDGPYVWHVFVD